MGIKATLVAAWKEWIVFLGRILRFPFRLLTNVKLLLYFSFAICVFGALGAWIPAFQIWYGIRSASGLSVHHNLATYVIGIAVTSLADCVVRRGNEDDGAFRLFILILTALAVIFAIIVLLNDDLSKVKIFSVTASVIAALVWLMVNDSHPDLIRSDAYSAIGGENPRP